MLENPRYKVADDCRLAKPGDWDGYMKLAERLIAAIEDRRKPKP